jgi:nitroreductase
MFMSKLYNGLPAVLLILAGSRYAAGFTNVARPYNADSFLRAAKEESKSSTATIEKEKSDETEVSDDTDADSDADDFDTILRSRRTINSFLSDLPNDWEETLENAIESAIYAPNHKRTEPWRFHLLGPEAIRKVCELNASIVTKKKGKKAGQAKLERWLEMPGWLVVTCNKTSSTEESKSKGMDDPAGIEREDYAAVCCAVQNLCLSLHNAGMGTKWTTGPVNFDKRFGKIVGFEADDEYVVGTLWFGTPEKEPEAPVKKKSLKDVFQKTT